VPFSRLADIIEISKKEMDDLGLFASILGHIGDGNFHESIMYNRKDEAERAKVEACVKNMVKRALAMDGTCTGEHSIGWGKKESLLWEVGSDTVDVMVRLPSLFSAATAECRSVLLHLGLQPRFASWIVDRKSRTMLTRRTESDQNVARPSLDHVSTPSLFLIEH
jgi:hypothetical protein